MKTTKNEESPWQKTRYANLVRYKPSGKYFARVKCGGKLIRETLKTDSITVAKDRLDEIVKRERRLMKTRHEIAKGRVTFGDALKMYRMRIDGDASLKPRTKAYYSERIKALLKSWPDVERKDVAKITKTDCLNWSAGFATTISPNAFNHTLAILKHTLAIGVEVGARHDNPADAVKRVKERKKVLELPTKAEFQAIVDCIRNAGGGRSYWCADLILFLAYGGFRISESANIRWKDIDFSKQQIFVRGDDETGTKNGEWRFVPMSKQMLELLQRLKVEAGGNPAPDAPVMRVRECQKSIDRAAKELGIKRFTHHDLRHLFITLCLEQNTSPATIAHWCGHKDRGVLVLRTYGHLRQEHSRDAMSKLSFPTETRASVSPAAESDIEKSIHVLSGNSDTAQLKATA